MHTIPDIQSQTLQPVVCADDTKSATVSTTVVDTPTSTVPYCTTVSQLTDSTTNVANANIVPMINAQPICENVAASVSMPATNLGNPPKSFPNSSHG